MLGPKSRILRKIGLWLGAMLLLSCLLFAFRYPLLKGLGRYLVKEDPTPPAVDAILTLAGDPEERMGLAATLWRQGIAPLVVCTGSQVNGALRAVGVEAKDAEIGKWALIRYGVDSSAVLPLAQGSSTWEESERLLEFSIAQGWKRVMVVTSALHTRRVRWVFRKKFQQAGIGVFVTGSRPEADDYDLDQWWKSEKGLLFVNNEYVKLAYYLLKYSP